MRELGLFSLNISLNFIKLFLTVRVIVYSCTAYFIQIIVYNNIPVTCQNKIVRFRNKLLINSGSSLFGQ